MTKARARARSNPSPASPARSVIVIDPVRVSYLADRVQAGDVVQTASVEEFGALLEELKQRGYVLQERSAAARERAPFMFEVTRRQK